MNQRAAFQLQKSPGQILGVAPVYLLVGGLLCLPLAGTAQSAGVNQAGPDYVHAPAEAGHLPQHGNPDSAAAKVDQMRQAERQRRIAADTAKLVELSHQLKAETDRAPNQLSIAALQTANEIEKTAHDLKGWLKE